MCAKMISFASCRVAGVLFLGLAMIISVVGCASSSPQSSLMAYRSPYEQRFIMPGLVIRHNLLNSKYQQPESVTGG